MNKDELIQLAREKAAMSGVNPELLLAIIQTESSFDPWVVRFEPRYSYFWFPRESASQCNILEETERNLQATSWGLCQVMGGVARELGFEKMLTQLVVPENCIYIGCLKIKQLMQRYGEESESDIIAGYNAGSARKLPSGMYRNQTYLDKVHRELETLRKLK